jgi:macrodomain Ter protein organizer (MatP/YcbG family)
MMERKTTSIKVDPQLWKDFKKLAIDQDKDLSDVLEQMIREKVRGK